MTKKMPATMRKRAIPKKSNQRRTSMIASDPWVGSAPPVGDRFYRARPALRPIRGTALEFAA